MIAPVIQIWADLSVERTGYFRAFWCESADATSGSPIIGYCDSGHDGRWGSYPTIKACAAAARQLYPGVPIYRPWAQGGGKAMNREDWLKASTVALRAHFATHGYTVPDNVRATCGFPSRSAMAARKRRLGECWSAEASAGAVFEVFISPIMADSIEVLAILAHELVHATVGLKAGHGNTFKRCATAIGLEGKMTSTTAGDAFKRFAKDFVARIGAYPHSELNPRVGVKKQSTRLIKCACDECGYTVRVARTWLENAGAPICPLDRQPMTY